MLLTRRTFKAHSILEVLRGGRRVEGPLPPKCAAALGCDNDYKSVCDGVRMDGKWQYQPVCEGPSRCGSVEARMFVPEHHHLHLSLITTRLL